MQELCVCILMMLYIKYFFLIYFSYHQTRKTWWSLDSFETLFALVKTNKQQVTVTNGKEMINSHYYHTGWLTYMLKGGGLYNNDTWVIRFLRGKCTECSLTFSPGDPGGPGGPGCPSLP